MTDLNAARKQLTEMRLLMQENPFLPMIWLEPMILDLERELAPKQRATLTEKILLAAAVSFVCLVILGHFF